MTAILIIAEHDGQKLNPATARCVSCAKALPDAKITLAVLAAEPGKVAAQAAALAGVAEVVTIANPANAHPLAAVLAPQVAALAADYSHLLGPSTTFGKDLMPRVAALLGVGQISDVMAVESAYRFRRPVYAGNAIATVEAAADAKVVATVRTASFEAAGGGGSAPVRAVSVNATLPTHTRFVSVKTGNTDRPDLQSASRVVSGGRALGSAEHFKLIYALAEKWGAAVGASRAAVDAGYAPNELQVGQTGKIIAPELYVAIGISGAIQHLTGIKDARTIVAINKDGEAPIFEVADLGLVGDLFQIVPELEKLVQRPR
jgi:electron transfer flavoprotein alpha subunit